jgi:hypothetical protein
VDYRKKSAVLEENSPSISILALSPTKSEDRSTSRLDDYYLKVSITNKISGKFLIMLTA